MRYLSDICSLCVEPHENLKNLISQDNDGVVIEEKVKIFLMELVNFKPDIPKYACNNCLENLNDIYKFRLKCLKNISALNEYLQTRLISGFNNKQTNKGREIESTNQQNVEETFPNATHNFEDSTTKSTNEVCVKNEIDDDFEQIIIKTELPDEINIEEQTNMNNTNKSFSEDVTNMEVDENMDSHMPFEHVDITNLGNSTRLQLLSENAYTGNYSGDENAPRNSNSESSDEELRKQQEYSYTGQRGRKRTNYWKRRAFLSMKSYLDVMPSNDEVQFLELNGLGKSQYILKFKRYWSLKRTAEYIQSAFPTIPLNSIGFKYARCNRGKKVELINPKTMEQLESEVRNGVVIILPNEDIRLENPVTLTKNQDCPFYVISKKVPWQPATNDSQTSTTSSTELSAPSASSKVNKVSLKTLPTQQLNKNQFRVILPKIIPTETPNIDFEDEILPNVLPLNEPQIASESDVEPETIPAEKETPSSSNPIVKHTSGKIVSLEQRIKAFNHYVERRKAGLSKTSAAEDTAFHQGLSIKFIFKLVHQMEQNGKITMPSRKRNRQTFFSKLTEDEKNVIIDIVDSFYAKKETPTLNKVYEAVKENQSIARISRTTLFIVLKKLGFDMAGWRAKPKKK